MHSTAHSLPDIIFMLLFISVAGHLIYRMFRYGGFTAGMLGAKINEELGEVTCTRNASFEMGKTTIRVQALNGKDSPGKDVGIAIVSKSKLGYRSSLASLSRESTQELITILQRAVKAAEERQ